MRQTLNILNFILYGNLFISVCAAGLAYQTYLLAGIPVSLRLCAIIFFSTLFVYNVDGMLPYKLKQMDPASPRARWVKEYALLLRTLSLASLLCVFTLYYMALFELNFWFILHLVVVAGFYSVPFIPEGDRYLPLRDIPLLKVFLIAYVWTAITVQLPQMEAGRDLFSPESLTLFGRRFLFIFALTLVFDIRDLHKDTSAGTVTFPVKWGIKKTQQIALFALLLFIVLVPVGVPFSQSLALGISGIGAALVVWKAHAGRSQYYYLIVADGMMLVQVLLVWLFT